MNRLEKDANRFLQLNNTHYEHTILVSNSVLSKKEVFILTALGFWLYFCYYQNDISIVGNSKIIGVILLILILIRFFTRIICGVKTESIFIVKALGLQTTTVYHSNFKSFKFIPWHSINDVIINEAIVMQRVIFYLAVLVKAEEKKEGEIIFPIFIHAQPRLSELKKIYRNIQNILRN